MTNAIKFPPSNLFAAARFCLAADLLQYIACIYAKYTKYSTYYLLKIICINIIYIVEMFTDLV